MKRITRSMACRTVASATVLQLGAAPPDRRNIRRRGEDNWGTTGTGAIIRANWGTTAPVSVRPGPDHRDGQPGLPVDPSAVEGQHLLPRQIRFHNLPHHEGADSSPACEGADPDALCSPFEFGSQIAYRNLRTSRNAAGDVGDKHDCRCFSTTHRCLSSRGCTPLVGTQLMEAPQSVIEVGHVPFKDRATLCGGVTLVGYASRYEGFGLPPQ
jgi:hypothetical protein